MKHLIPKMIDSYKAKIKLKYNRMIQKDYAPAYTSQRSKKTKHFFAINYA